MLHVVLLIWIGILLFVGAIIAGVRAIGDYHIWLEFADTILLIAIAISLLHIARRP
jgi:hypothetical protein